MQDIAEGNPGVAVEALRGGLQDVSNDSVGAQWFHGLKAQRSTENPSRCQ